MGKSKNVLYIKFKDLANPMYRQRVNRITNILPWKAVSFLGYPYDFDYDECG